MAAISTELEAMIKMSKGIAQLTPEQKSAFDKALAMADENGIQALTTMLTNEKTVMDKIEADSQKRSQEALQNYYQEVNSSIADFKIRNKQSASRRKEAKHIGRDTAIADILLSSLNK